jgi:lipooligosaccharide transport system permease protein
MTTLAARLGGLAPTRLRVPGLRLFERNAMVYRRTWMILFSGFFEPLLYLLAFGVGLGSYVGTVTLDGETLEYAVFIAPGLLAVSAMNGAFYDATNVFWKLRYGKVYDSVLATPIGPRDVAVGESLWAVFRSLLYSTAFLCLITAMGLVESWWALLALPAALLIGLAFAGAGIAAVTWMRTWKDFEILNLVMLPLFLFSATFYPISVYPQVLQWVVQALPLYHGVALIRALTTGAVGPEQLGNVAYLVALGLIGIALAGRRIHGLLLK